MWDQLGVYGHFPAYRQEGKEAIFRHFTVGPKPAGIQPQGFHVPFVIR